MRFFPSLLILPLLALLLGAGCKKDKVTPAEQLPPATTSGANTWGCLVNGEVWQATGSSYVNSDWTVSDGITITMGHDIKENGATKYGNIAFTIPDTTNSFQLRAGSFKITSGGHYGCFVRLLNRTKWYFEGKALKGQLILTRLDRQTRIVSGTFEFTMASGPGDTIRVTQGRFDIGNMDL